MGASRQNILDQARERFVFRNTFILIAFMYISVHTLSIIKDWGAPMTASHFWRIIQFSICLSGVAALLIMKDRWKQKHNLILLLAITLPSYPFIWFYIKELVDSGLIFAPYNVIRVHYFYLALLVPHTYWINFLLMMGFTIEAGVMWFYFDLPHITTAAMGAEPMGVLASLIVSLAILFYRKKDEELIQAFITQEARSEIVTQMARTFLSIKDKANTPLQSLLIGAKILEKKYPQETELIKTLENNVHKLNESNAILSTLENRLTWKKDELMSEKEILEWLAEFHDENQLQQ